MKKYLILISSSQMKLIAARARAIIAHQLNFVSYKRRVRRLMTTSANLYGGIAVGPCQPMKPVKSRLMKLQNWSRPQLKRPLLVLHKRAYQFQREIKLP